MRLILININAFKNKLFPFYLGNYYEESSKSEDKMPDISTFEQITDLDTFYGHD